MFHGEHCVAMASVIEEIVDVFFCRCLHGWTVSTHVKFERFFNIFIGVIATSSFMARDAMETAYGEISDLA